MTILNLKCSKVWKGILRGRTSLLQIDSQYIFRGTNITCRAVKRSENKLIIRDCQRHLEDCLNNFNVQNNLQIQKCFTLALLVLLVSNIISDDDDNDENLKFFGNCGAVRKGSCQDIKFSSLQVVGVIRTMAMVTTGDKWDVKNFEAKGKSCQCLN